jgi:uncharacterized protein
MGLPLDGPFAGLHIVDTDTHWSEPYDLWTSRAPAKWLDQMPHVEVDANGKEQWILLGETMFGAGGASFVNKKGEKFTGVTIDRKKGTHWEDIHPGSYDPKARLEFMDKQSVWAHIMYPNTMGFGAGQICQKLPLEISVAIVEMYNDAIAEVQAEGEGRLFPMGVIPYWDIEASVKESQRIKELGLKGITMAGSPHLGGLPDLGQPEWDPLYEALTDLELPINIHVLTSNHMALTLAQVAWKSIETRAVKPVNSVQMELSNSAFISNLVVSDVLLKWPELKWVSVESGLGWIPYVLERVDYEYREEFPDLPAPERPGAFEMFRRNIYAMFWFEQAGPKYLMEYLGADNIMWESDFPHPTSLYPSPVERTAELLVDADPVTIRKVMQDNAAKLYHLEIPKD